MNDEDLLPISALQHYLYCPRQCALIHIEQQWEENRQTAEGQLLHTRTDQPLSEQRKGVRTITAMPLVSLELGITGVADVVEFHDALPFPVEYKRGKPKAHHADEVQLCAQALCLENMFNCAIIEGALFYGQTRRRQDVVFDAGLRTLTFDAITRTRSMIVMGKTPPAEYSSGRCDACSLLDLCQPRLLAHGQGVSQWLLEQLEN